ncbi:hypothetical protein K8I61_00745 [bacterium]|nr:hypothetical protein [bacterium]
MAEIFDLPAMIKKSINRERISFALYRGWEGRFADDAANRMARMLAREEEGHVKMLEMTLADGKLERLGKRAVKPRTGPVPRVPEVDELTENSTAREVVAYAIGHEDRAIRYYARYLDVFRDTPLQEFFRRMVREEETHKDRLENVFLKEFGGRRA